MSFVAEFNSLPLPTLVKRSLVRNAVTDADGRESFEGELTVAYQKLGIKPNCLYRWRAELAPSPAVPPSAKADSNADLRAQLNAALHELRRVTEQRDILKKTLGIISAPSESGS